MVNVCIFLYFCLMKAVFENFDPNAPAQSGNANIFGLPSTEENSDLVIVPVPWEVTTSYRPGTAAGPELVFEASMQVDLYDADNPGAWKNGFYMMPVSEEITQQSETYRARAEILIEALEAGRNPAHETELTTILQELNQASASLNDWVFQQTKTQLEKGKKVALLGGDHSTPYGFVKALSEKHEHFAVLQIDAHADLRQAYEGFQHSHASIMYNLITDLPNVNLVQFGIRDYCDEEVEFMAANPSRIRTFFDRDIKRSQYEGVTWQQICADLIATLPDKVYISFDIDGLDPKLCPNTGTPVPGGFELEQVFYLFEQLRQSGKQLIGFDVNEVSGSESGEETIDPIVGARLLYKLCGYLIG